MFGQLRKTTTKSNELGWRTLKWITLKLSAHLNCEKKEVNQRYPTWHEILENENVVVEQNLLDRFSSNDRNGFSRTFFIELSTKCNFRSRHLLPVAPVYSGSGSRHRKDLGVSISRTRWPIFINSFTFNFVHMRHNQTSPFQIKSSFIIDNPNPLFKMDWQSNYKTVWDLTNPNH